ncbi:uncharacterized protein LOC110436901 isoform X2 [Sorghum bicolor]|nr:uncharacterized protein LOC110436901 isoform X2 [Sorghum bicolor]|eukprot:XP_021320270.1 uncharacterized protein LOC110436901 isoform X2 [Sorghum bicolor]
MMVDRWCGPEWAEAHNAARERRLLMPGVTNHQGSRSLAAYGQAWSAAHAGQECTTFMAYAMAHKGKATSDVSYNPDDPPEAYTNPTAYDRISEYTSAARSIHGNDYNPSSHDLDAEVVMRIGGGKKHERLHPPVRIFQVMVHHSRSGDLGEPGSSLCMCLFGWYTTVAVSWYNIVAVLLRCTCVTYLDL